MSPRALIPRARRCCAAIGLLLLMAGCGNLPPNPPGPQSRALFAPQGTLAGTVRASGSAAPGMSGFRLLPVPSYALDARLALAARAERSLDLQYYELRADSTGLQLLAALAAAARRGVRVRLLVDDLHAGGEDCLFAALQKAGNLQVRLFNPFAARGHGMLWRFAASAADFRRLERRMHNKAFIADGVLAVAGGRNIADEYFLRAPDGNFLDLDMLVAGALVADLAASFDGYWNSAWAYPVQLLAPAGCVGQARPVPATTPADADADADADAEAEAVAVAAAGEARDPLGIPTVGSELQAGRLTLVWAPGEVVADAPAKVDPAAAASQAAPATTVRGRLRERVAQARSSVVTTSPYLVPGASGMALLRGLRARGVRVALVTNSMAAIDEPLAFVGYMRYRKRLLQLGVELFELSPARVARSHRFHLAGRSSGRLHAKAAAIDGSTVFIGSMNLDPRSARHNTEVGVFVDSDVLAGQLLQLIDLVESQGGYRVRITAGGAQRWGGQDSETPGHAGATVDPETSLGERILLWLLDPLVPEELL